MDGSRKAKNLSGKRKYYNWSQRDRFRCTSIEEALEHSARQSPDKRYTRNVKVAKTNTRKWAFIKSLGTKARKYQG